jgi:hypothetical protein
MTHAFEAGEGEPSRLTAGDFWTWRRDDLAADYPPTAFALSYALAAEGGGASSIIAATGGAEGYLVEIAPATSAAFAPGRYAWRALVTRVADGARISVGSGVLTVDPDPATATGDRRSVNRRILDALEARLAGRIEKDAESYTIEGRSVARMPIAEVERLVNLYRVKVRAEDGKPGLRRKLWAFK